jgi:hypothetical protein
MRGRGKPVECVENGERWRFGARNIKRKNLDEEEDSL